ncbi:MAG: hypothetical protein AB7W47_03950 [Calditrichaceae bacterium]
MTMSSQSMAIRMMAAELAITNALSDEQVKSYLAEYGYDDTRLNEGKALFDTAHELQQKQIREYGEQYEATDAVNSVKDKASAVYMKHVKIARIALQSDRGAAQKLDLNGRRKGSLSGWLAQATQFYINATTAPDIITAMAKFNITEEKLLAGKQLIEETVSLNAAQEKEKGEAQQATVERDEALDALEFWLSDFIAIARIALEEKPQLLEKLGIVERS